MERSENKFTVKDLVNAGLFTLLILACVWATGMLGYMPFLMPIIPFLCSLVGGIPYMLYVTRIRHFGMLCITGAVFIIVYTLGGESLYTLPLGVLGTLLAEWALKKGGYKSVKMARWSWVLFSILESGSYLPLFIARDATARHLVQSGFGTEYVKQLFQFMPVWLFPFIAILGLLGAWLGATLGKRINDKHFKKAGII